jgi:hypothetical protein
VQLLDLLLGDVNLFERRGHLVEGDEPALARIREKRAKLVHFGERSVTVLSGK